MAFSFDTFAKDQKQSAIDVVDTITPSQVKQVGAAYKAGLNASPKQVINETLESFTGVDLSQGAGVDGLGAQAKNFIEGQAASLTMQLEQQVLGCINTAIRDLMNKVPALDFILNFEDRINGILGKFRNKLEQKIDAELRKLTYEKIKVHQVTLFKQRIRGKIKDICPAATPASVAEVQDFNNKIKGLISKRSIDNTVIDTAKTLNTDKINEAKVEVKGQVATPFEGISNKRKQTFQQDPVETKKIVDEKVAQASAEVKQETEDQLEKKEDETIEGLVRTEPTEDDVFKPFKWSDHDTVHIGMINLYREQISTAAYDSKVGAFTGSSAIIAEGQSGDQYKQKLDYKIKEDVDGLWEGLIGIRVFKEYVDTGIDHRKSETKQKSLDASRKSNLQAAYNNPDQFMFASLAFEAKSYDNNNLNVVWNFRLVYAPQNRTFRKDLELEVLIHLVDQSLSVSNSSPKAAIYEAQKQVKAKMIEIIKNTTFKR